MPEYAKDVVLALLGASIALAGLLLVVSGFALAQANSYPAETTDDLRLGRYELAAKLGLVPFLIALVDGALCLIWLLHRSDVFYRSAVGGFFLLLSVTAIYGAVLLLKYL